MSENATATNILQQLSQGDALANAITTFSGRVVEAFAAHKGLEDYGENVPIPKGSGAIAKNMRIQTRHDIVRNHTPGTSRRDNAGPAFRADDIVLDATETVADAWVTFRDLNISHFDPFASLANSIADALREARDRRTIKVIVRGSMLAAQGTEEYEFYSLWFPDTEPFRTWGQRILKPAGETVDTLYPISLAGSQAIQRDLQEFARRFDANNLPKTDRAVFMSPRLVHALLEDKSLTSLDQRAPLENDRINLELGSVEGFEVVSTNLIPDDVTDASHTDGSANVGHSNYEADCTNLLMVAVGDRSAFGKAIVSEVEADGPYKHDEERAWFASGAYHGGFNYIRPEACGTLAIDY